MLWPHLSEPGQKSPGQKSLGCLSVGEEAPGKTSVHTFPPHPWHPGPGTPISLFPHNTHRDAWGPDPPGGHRQGTHSARHLPWLSWARVGRRARQGGSPTQQPSLVPLGLPKLGQALLLRRVVCAGLAVAGRPHGVLLAPDPLAQDPGRCVHLEVQLRGEVGAHQVGPAGALAMGQQLAACLGRCSETKRHRFRGLMKARLLPTVWKEQPWSLRPDPF